MVLPYQINANKLNGVIGAYTSLKHGTDLAQAFNSCAEVNGKSEIPTGQVNGQLSNGIFTSADLGGPLTGKSVNDLTTLMKNDSVYVVVRTQAHENGEWRNRGSRISFKQWLYADSCLFRQMKW